MFVIFAGCAAALGQNQKADDAASKAAALESTLAQLNDQDYAKRRAAHVRLLRDDSLSAQAVAQLYRKATTLEQKNRLLDVARHHFIRELRLEMFPGPRLGALGVIQSAMSEDQLPQVGRAAARVVDTLPGFPAYAYLEPGDLVLAVDGQPLPSGLSPDETSAHFGRMIIDHRQDSVLHLDVWRGGKTLNISLRLASSDAIRTMFDSTSQRLLPQYRVRWLRYLDDLLEAAADKPPLSVKAQPPAKP